MARRDQPFRNYQNANDMTQQHYQAGNDIYQLNNERMTIEQLVDYIQGDLTFSGLMPKVLPDLEILRIVKEEALEWFYKKYQFAVIKSFYRLDKSFINSEEYTAMGYITLPEEVENITRIVEINNPSLFRIGIQAPNLSINFGVTNQPYLTSFVSNVGELATYRQILSSFSDEINKMSRNYTKFSFNQINKRLNILDEIRSSFMLEVYIRIQQEEIFANHLFKKYVKSLSKIRLGEALGRLSFSMPGNFQYNAADLISQGQSELEKVIEQIVGESPNNSFFIMSK
ncbi:MAG: hypothetical protein WDA02_08400 [Saccharofermentanales bacterium]